MHLFPRRIARYIFNSLRTPTLLSLLFFASLLLMNRFFLIAEKALAKNLGWDLILRMLGVYLPTALVMAIPMAVLLGTMIAVGRLSADHEWVALQGAGQGPWRLLRTVMTFGLLGSLLSFVIYAVGVPRANYAMRNLRGELLFASNLASDLKPRAFYTNLPDAVLYVDDIRPGGERRLHRVLTVKTDPKEQSTELFLARNGDLYPAPGSEGGLILDLYDGVFHIYNSDSPETYRYGEFDFHQLPLDLAAYLRGFLSPPEKVVSDLSPAELWKEWKVAGEEQRRLDDSSRSGEGPSSKTRLFLVQHRLRTATIELHRRLALPMACLVFSFLAVPLGVTRVRTGKGAAFALSLAVILLYWIVFTVATNQAGRGLIPAWLGPWAGNLILLPWGLWGVRRLHRPPVDRPALVSGLFGGGRGSLRWVASRTRLQRVRQPSDEEAGDNGSGIAPLDDFGGTPNRFVRRLDQYIGLTYLRVILLSLVGAYLIFALVELKNLTEGILRTQQPFSLVLSYLKYFAPGGRSGELTAIKSSGISMRRTTLPIVVLTFLLAGVAFLVQDRIAPAANRKAQAVKDQINGRAPRTYGSPVTGRWSFGPEGRRLYHYRLYDPDRERFQDLTVFSIDRAVPRILDHRFSRHALWRGDTWELESGWYRTLPTDPARAVYEVSEGTEQLALDPPTNFANKRLTRLSRLGDLPQQMSLSELRKEIESLADSGRDITRLRVDYHGKWAQPMAPVVMILLGLPFAFKIGRRGSLYGIGVALLLVIVYWAAFAIFNALGLETILNPVVAAWAPNILFGLVGTYLMLYIRT
jgi:LPS export ABC transporter permease LptF/LPS export ABC transporter permease LptG